MLQEPAHDTFSQARRPGLRRPYRTWPAVLLVAWMLHATPCPADATASDLPDTKTPVWAGALDTYQRLISRADGQRCPMTPSCSQYARQALEKHGFFTGWVLTSDRLLRCGRDEVRRAPRVRTEGGVRAYDPLDGNTFWWERP